MKSITTFLLIFVSLTSFSQSIESITEKVSDKICDCIQDDIRSYSDIKPEFNRCYDKEFNQLFSLVDSAEQKILVQKGALEEIKNRIIPTLNMNCEKLKTLIQSDVENALDSAANSNQKPCPTNFKGQDLEKINTLNGEIIALNGLITEVHAAHQGKPYYRVALEGGNTIWIASLVNSGYEKEGNIIRLLGYVSEVGDNEMATQYNNTDYHILAFCVIDMDSQQMALLPGSEAQVKEWMNGTIPKAKN